MVFFPFIMFIVLIIYFKMLYNNDVKDISIEVAENQRVVIEPTLEFWAFTLLGSTYTMSFCCR